MTQQELDAEVAMALGEDVSEIRRRGFSIADPAEANFDPEPDDLAPQWMNWDEYEADRCVTTMPQPPRRLIAA